MLDRIKNISREELLNKLFIAYAFIIPLSRAGIVLFSFLILIVWITNPNRKNDFLTALSTKPIQALLVYILFSAIALAWVEWHNLYVATQDLIKFWYFIPIIAMSVYIRQETIYKAISAFLFALFISEIISYGAFFKLFTFMHATHDYPTPFMNHLDYALFLSLASLIILTRLIYEKELKYKILFIFFYITITANLFIGQGRIGQLTLIIAMLLLFLNIFEHKIKAFFLTLILLSTIFTLAYNFSNTFHNRVEQGINDVNGIVEKQNYCSSWGNRLGAIIITKDILKEDPLLGVGAEDHLDKLKEMIDTKYPQMKCLRWYMHYHNQYLEVLSQLGVVGLVLFLAIFYQLYRLKFRNKEFTMIKIIFLTEYLVGFIADPFFLFKIFPMAMFVLFFGLLNAQYIIENSLRDPKPLP